MDIGSLIIKSFKNILFALAVVVTLLPIMLSMPGFTNYLYSFLNILGIGE
ncbi:MAG: hypothetical protein IT280_05850 [Ignavibacteria bacterium]|nr:hypothetical protein [Ignavibacteria bacterium]